MVNIRRTTSSAKHSIPSLRSPPPLLVVDTHVKINEIPGGRRTDIYVIVDI